MLCRLGPHERPGLAIKAHDGAVVPAGKNIGIRRAPDAFEGCYCPGIDLRPDIHIARARLPAESKKKTGRMIQTAPMILRFMPCIGLLTSHTSGWSNTGGIVD